MNTLQLYHILFFFFARLVNGIGMRALLAKGRCIEYCISGSFSINAISVLPFGTFSWKYCTIEAVSLVSLI